MNIRYLIDEGIHPPIHLSENLSINAGVDATLHLTDATVLWNISAANSKRRGAVEYYLEKYFIENFKLNFRTWTDIQ